MKRITYLSLLIVAACNQNAPAPMMNHNNSTITTRLETKNEHLTDFLQWKQHFYQKALHAEHNPQAITRLLDSAEYLAKTVKADRNQPEANPMIWQYLDKAINDKRIQEAKKLAVDKRFQIPTEYVIAIWGMESGFGKNMGKNYLPSTLATLAFDGRRRDFAENQLLALLTLLEHGDLDWNNLYGSWAGGMGHTQFIPTTFLQYGVDADGDGKRNPFNQADALASTAHYLNASGWQKGTWGEIVYLPDNFNYDLLDKSLSPHQLNSLNVRRTNGKPIMQSGKIWLPAGINGSALLLYPNFNKIKVYNNSNNYALAISLAADKIAGRTIDLVFPRSEIGLNSNETKLLQNKLNLLGYDAGTADGILGTKTRNAFKAWQAHVGVIPDGFISKNSTLGLIQ